MESSVLTVIANNPGLKTEEVIDLVLDGKKKARAPIRAEMHRLADEGQLAKDQVPGKARIRWYLA
jgi:hypothetical protein